MGNHTTSDDASRYRTEAEVNAWSKRDPIEIFRVYLKRKGLWDESFEDRVQKEAEEMINKAVEEAESAPPPRPEDIFIYTYNHMTPDLNEQLAELQNFLKEGHR
jgi:pyruvate dehydrogenase E1 component alpha subunit